jgi:hypothetical protein
VCPLTFAFDSAPTLWHTSAVGTATGGTDMPLQTNLSELERRHQALEREIQDAMSHPSSDDLKVAELKRRKLQLKDEITKLRTSDARVVH